jgi:hypothetical protein
LLEIARLREYTRGNVEKPGAGLANSLQRIRSGRCDRTEHDVGPMFRVCRNGDIVSHGSCERAELCLRQTPRQLICNPQREVLIG